MKRARQEAGLTQAELARRIGVTPRTVWNWEWGHREPRGKYLRALAAVTGKPIAWFFEGYGA